MFRHPVSTALFTVVLVCSVATPTRAASLGGAGGLTVTVLGAGSYTISVPQFGWSFSGNIGAALNNLTVQSGTDAAGGAYSEVVFDVHAPTAVHAAIRSYYGSKAVLFTWNLPAGGPNNFSFPSFSSYPGGLQHIAFSGVFAFPTFHGTNTESPWVGFDEAFHTAILSPASHFMVASTGESGGRLATGISPQIATLPAGFTQQALLVIEDGINRGFDRWGQLLTGWTRKARPPNDADLTLSHLGYWTDAGSSYYYTMAGGMSYPDTMAAVKADFDKHGVKLGYLQLDSWFYPKGAADDWTAMSGGIYEYMAASPPFRSTLETFQSAIGIPLVTHARWIDPASPYRQQFRMSGNVAIDPLYWAQIGAYLSMSGAVTFEQDWLFDRASTDYNLTDADAFLDNMASAMAQQNISIQYCSGTARHFLQSAKYGNVTTVRASSDRFNRSRWWTFLYASRLASAVGVWPFTDVLMTSETDNLLLATLSAGPVGVGDRIGFINGDNLRRAVRGDGMIVKPDVPLAPIDSMYRNDAVGVDSPMIAATHTDFGDLRAWYLFEYPEGSNTQAVFHLADAGVDRPVFLYDYLHGAGRIVQPDELLALDVTGYGYQIAAPIGPSGIAMLGDAGHFVSLGRKRVTELSDDGGIYVSVAFAPGEAGRTLYGYAPGEVTVTPSNGRVDRVFRSAATGLFRVHVRPGDDGSVSVVISPSRSTSISAPPRRGPATVR